MKRPLVSVLIPVYNVEEYLERCLKSVIGQTIRDIEIICVDDGSTDGSAAILERYRKKEARLRIITKENGGLPSARNAGLDAAGGRYVGFVDSDDYVQPDMFEKLVRAAEKKGAEVVICGANVFPEQPRAGQWLYDALSPVAAYYKEYRSELLFGRYDTTPFLWRTLMKKELIDREKLRLDEEIIIGEDKAFQCKVYPRAKGIAVIPDKLYNYYWCRPDSLMGKRVYGKLGERVTAHTKLAERIVQDLRMGGMPDGEWKHTQKGFLEWSIPFLYDDFQAVSLSEKGELAARIAELWESMGYLRYRTMLPQWKQEAFASVKQLSGRRGRVAELSLIVPVEQESRCLEEWVRQAEALASGGTEIIVLNNGMSQDIYRTVQRLAQRKPYVRLVNTPEHFTYAGLLNMGIALAEGEYLGFWDPEDWYAKPEKVRKWLSYARREKADICIGKTCLKHRNSEWGGMTPRRESVQGWVFDMGFHSGLYRRIFLKETGLCFSERSLLTGYVFWCRGLLSEARAVSFGEDVYALRRMPHAYGIHVEKCRQMLEGLWELENLSLEKHSQFLHGKVFSLLNAERMKQILASCAGPCTDAGAESQRQMMLLLFKIAGGAEPDFLKECGFESDESVLDALYEVIHQREICLSAK